MYNRSIEMHSGDGRLPEKPCNRSMKGWVALMSIFFKPEHARVGDIIPFYDNGIFNLFYLKNWGDYDGPDRKPGWHRLTTTDNVNMTSETATGIRGGTGCVVKTVGVYHLFYCIFRDNPQRQYVCHAISEDMERWHDLPEDTFGPDERIYLPTDWRDPHVFWCDEDQCWWMVLCAQSQGKTRRRGCVGLCKSKDLSRWNCCEPLYDPHSAMSGYECPDVFEMNGWWYLVFSQYTDGFHTTYRMSRSPRGPWFSPRIDTFDSRAFYAAKTGSDDAHRYIYGWNPTRENDEYGFNPRGYNGKDCNTWDWGGSMIIHELWQAEDGALYVKPVQTVMEAINCHINLEPEPLTGKWQKTERGWRMDAPHGYTAMLAGSMDEVWRLSVDVQLTDITSRFGVALHVDEDFAEGYYVVVDLRRGRVEFQTPVRMTERGGKMFPYEVELERPLPPGDRQRFHIDVIAEGTVLEVYLNQSVALSARMYDRSGGSFGFFVSEGSADFEMIQTWRES